MMKMFLTDLLVLGLVRKKRELYPKGDDIQKHYLHPRWFQSSGRITEKTMKFYVMKTLKNLIVKMMNKSLNKDSNPIQVHLYKIPSVVNHSFAKFACIKSLSLSINKAIVAKKIFSKDKELDHLEDVKNILTKPVDKIHISNVMSLGKKNKKTKKNK